MVAALALVACGGEAGGPSASEAAFARWEAGEPDVRIGSIEGETVLGRVLGVAIGPDHSVYVLDGQEAAVRVFDETGRPLRTVGRKGGGRPRRVRDAQAHGLSRRHALGMGCGAESRHALRG